jgi:hypothetical protein
MGVRAASSFRPRQLFSGTRERNPLVPCRAHGRASFLPIVTPTQETEEPGPGLPRWGACSGTRQRGAEDSPPRGLPREAMFGCMRFTPCDVSMREPSMALVGQTAFHGGPFDPDTFLANMDVFRATPPAGPRWLPAPVPRRPPGNTGDLRLVLAKARGGECLPTAWPGIMSPQDLSPLPWHGCCFLTFPTWRPGAGPERAGDSAEGAG